MSKPRKDRIREERIRNEAVVDAYGPEEQVMGWYYYLENKLRFPFQAKCIASMVVSPTQKGRGGRSPAPGARRCVYQRHACADSLAGPEPGSSSLSQLAAVDADESTAEAIGDWHYCG